MDERRKELVDDRPERLIDDDRPEDRGGTAGLVRPPQDAAADAGAPADAPDGPGSEESASADADPSADPTEPLLAPSDGERFQAR